MNEQVIAHVLAVGANYWSIWNWHHISAANVLSYYDKYPAGHRSHRAAHRLSHLSGIHLAFERDGSAGVVIGLANDGVAGPPGVFRLTLSDAAGKVVASGGRRSGLSQADRNPPGDAELADPSAIGPACASAPSSK